MAQDYSALIQAMMQSPEVLELMKRTKQRSAEAEATGKGEAQRRGFVSGTGTSDIEMALRRAKTAPIEEAGALGVAGIVGRGAEAERGRQWGTSEREAGQKWRTGERLGGQEWQTGERLGGQEWRTGERIGGQEWGTQERLGGERHAAEMAGYRDPNTGEWISYESPLEKGKRYWGAAGAAERGRAHEYGMAQMQPKQKRKKWWESALPGVASAGGAALGAWMGPGGWWGK